MTQYRFVIDPDGNVRSLYNDALPWQELGKANMPRASYIRFDEATQEWIAERVSDGRIIARGKSRKEVARLEVEVLQKEL